MKTIGLIGGMSWESTVDYYKYINQAVNRQLGGLNSANIILHSVNFSEIEKLQHSGDWEGTAKILKLAAKSLQQAGADCIVICTNTMHKVAPNIERHCPLPILHIADATAFELKQQKISSVGLLGTKFTMQQSFYKDKLLNDFGVNVITPSLEEQEQLHNIIYNELCKGKIVESSKHTYVKIIENLHCKGAQGVILGCTEIPLLVKSTDTTVPLFDTTFIHSEYAAKWALD